jgi:hypothetical protein
MATQASAVRALDDAASPPRIPRAILQDRYDRATTADWGGTPTKLGDRLHRVIKDLIEEVTWSQWDGDLKQPNGLAGDGAVHDELEDLIREHAIRRVDELGLAR